MGLYGLLAIWASFPYTRVGGSVGLSPSLPLGVAPWLTSSMSLKIGPAALGAVLRSDEGKPLAPSPLLLSETRYH